MLKFTAPQRLLIVDIDGLRQDVFLHALAEGRIPNLAGLLSGPPGAAPLHLNPVSPAPSITFCAQTTIFTGQHPDVHGITGNQFFDRFGPAGGGGPRFYAFDVGDALAYHDAVLAFSGSAGLVGEALRPPVQTLYEMAARRGLRSTVVYNMVSRGASRWIRPNLVDIARFTKGGGLTGMSAEQFDREMMNKTLDHLRSDGMPDILTVYFMGLDHTSHHAGPGAQLDYLVDIVDGQVGRLVAHLRARGMLDGTLALVVSDHGQIEVLAEDHHSLRMSFPFDREMAYLFDALGLDVNDKPLEGPASDAVVATNGGMAHVYVRRHGAAWSIPPRFEAEVLRLARAFWAANQTGLYAQDLRGALWLVLARDAERQGWQADYQAVTPAGNLLPVADYLAVNPEVQTVDAPARLRHLAGPDSGDLLLVANYTGRFYFGAPTRGVHGGLHPEDSLAVASFGWPGATSDQWARAAQVVAGTAAQSQAEDGRTHPSLADLVPILARLMGW